MADNSTLAQIASIIAGFGAAMLFFRIQRELEMSKMGEQIWLPYSDRLLIYATLSSLFLVIFPMVIVKEDIAMVRDLIKAACAASVVMLGGYIPGILAHYRLILGKSRRGPRDNPEPAEKTVVIITLLVAFLAFLVTFFGIF